MGSADFRGTSEPHRVCVKSVQAGYPRSLVVEGLSKMCSQPCDSRDSGVSSSHVTAELQSLFVLVTLLTLGATGRSCKHLTVIRTSCLVTFRNPSLLVIEGILECQF